MIGKISRILREKSYGFIWDAMSNEYYFFHKQTVAEDSPIQFEGLKEGHTVSFEPKTRLIDGAEKTRAEEVCYLI